MKGMMTGLLAVLLAACGGRAEEAAVQDPTDEMAEVHDADNPLDDRSGLRPEGEAGASGVAAADVDLDTPLECPAPPGGSMGFGPIPWAEGTGDERWMFTETQVSSVLSSQQRPVEVCGVGGELQWLVGLTCPGGSHPYPDKQTAHASRVGNTGAGGRCGTIIDLYAVPCPDKQYEIYIDMYHCLPTESFF